MIGKLVRFYFAALINKDKAIRDFIEYYLGLYKQNNSWKISDIDMHLKGNIPKIV